MSRYENPEIPSIRPGACPLTAQQKTSLAQFFHLAGDYLRDGYIRCRTIPPFTDDPPPEEATQGLPPQADSLEALETEVLNCRGCALHTGRIKAVPGEGVPRPLVLVIGEGPGADEDASGRPFVGPAGQLLDRMLASVDLSRERNCFIANVVKCRPPHNRDPLPEETAACASFLTRQLSLLKPRMILCLGRVAIQALLHTDEGIGKLRGKLSNYQGFPLLGTYHPSALLRNASLKRPVWEDLKILRTQLAVLDQEGS